MRTLRGSVLAGALIVLAACGSDDDPVVTTIVVTPSTASIEVLGGTQQFSAEVQDQNGNVMSGQTVLWSTDDENVATVDQSGRVTALAEGNVNVAASVGNVAGTAAVIISSAPCTEEVSLNPGEVEVLPVACDVFIPSGSAGDRYRVAILNQSQIESESEVSDAVLTVTPVGATAAPIAAAPVAAQSTGADFGDPQRLSLETRKHLRWGALLENRTRATHRGLRAAEAALFRALGPDAVMADVRPLDGPQRQAEDLPDRITLRNNDGSSCSPPEDPTPAFLLGQNADLAVFQDSALNADPDTEVTPSEAQLILDYYSTYGRDVIDQYYPGVPDVDDNGKIIVYISFNDDLDDGATAAYVWGGDLFDGEDCEASNEAELTYFNAALVREVDDGFAQALETTVHEVKHISSFWQGIGRNRVLGLSNPFQPSWIEEGTAEIASNVATRVSWENVGGPSPSAKVTAEDIRDSAFDANDDIRPEALGIVIRMNRVQGYLSSQPNGLIETPRGADDGHSVYGSGWTFFRWLGDAYGNAATAPLADASFFADQNDSTTQNGIAGVEQVTGQSYDQLLEQFAAAMMLHETGAPEGVRAITSYDFISSIEMWCFAAHEAEPPCSGTGPPGTYPWPVTTTSDGVMGAPFDNGTFTGRIGPSGIRIHEFVSDGSGSGIQIGISAEQPARVVVTRIN
jgi:uncharacterized protein YjdB